MAAVPVRLEGVDAHNSFRKGKLFKGFWSNINEMNKRTFVIQTSTKNYILNLVISLLVPLLILAFLQTKRVPFIILIWVFLIIFLYLFRSVEYFLTGKSIDGLFPIWGTIEEGERAKYGVFLNILVVSSIIVYLFVIYFNVTFFYGT